MPGGVGGERSGKLAAPIPIAPVRWGFWSVYTEMKKGDRFSADSMEFDNLTQVLHMQGRVRGELQPPRRSPR